MRFIPFREAVCAVLLALAGAACVPMFENPLPVAPDKKPDPALTGTWAGIGENDNGSQVSFFPVRDGWLDILHATDTDGAAEHVSVMRYRGYTAAVEADQFLCLRALPQLGGDEVDTNGYILARYTINPPDALAIQIFDAKAVRALVATNKLEGTIREEGPYADDIRVTSSSVRLLSVLLAEGAGAFVDTNHTLRFVRLKAAAN